VRDLSADLETKKKSRRKKKRKGGDRSLGNFYHRQRMGLPVQEQKTGNGKAALRKTAALVTNVTKKRSLCQGRESRRRKGFRGLSKKGLVSCSPPSETGGKWTREDMNLSELAPKERGRKSSTVRKTKSLHLGGKN